MPDAMLLWAALASYALVALMAVPVLVPSTLLQRRPDLLCDGQRFRHRQRTTSPQPRRQIFPRPKADHLIRPPVGSHRRFQHLSEAGMIECAQLLRLRHEATPRLPIGVDMKEAEPTRLPDMSHCGIHFGQSVTLVQPLHSAPAHRRALRQFSSHIVREVT